MALPDIHWLITGEAAKRLGISREWARQLVQRGVLTGRATHAGLLIDPARVEAYVVERDIAAVVQDAERGRSSVPAAAIERVHRARQSPRSRRNPTGGSRTAQPTPYDCQYLALAERAGCEYWTNDARFVRGARPQFPHVRQLGR